MEQHDASIMSSAVQVKGVVLSVKGLGMSEGPRGLVNTTWRSRNDKYRINFLFVFFSLPSA